MTYIQSHRNRFSGRSRTYIAGGIFLVVLIVLISVIWPNFFPAFWTSFFSPFWRGETMISMGSLDSVYELLVKNQELQRELDEASIRLTSQAALEAENNELRAVIGKVSTSTYKIAPVLKRPPFSGYDELILDIGESEGIASGALVYSPGSVLIGKIESVFGHTSKAVLFTSPKQSHEVFIGSSKASAVAIGRGGGQYVAEVPRDIVVNPGDTVTASSLANRPFAIVSSVLNDPAQPFEKIFMSPPVNIYEIRWVLVQNTKE